MDKKIIYILMAFILCSVVNSAGIYTFDNLKTDYLLSDKGIDGVHCSTSDGGEILVEFVWDPLGIYGVYYHKYNSSNDIVDTDFLFNIDRTNYGYLDRAISCDGNEAYFAYTQTLSNVAPRKTKYDGDNTYITIIKIDSNGSHTLMNSLSKPFFVYDIDIRAEGPNIELVSSIHNGSVGDVNFVNLSYWINYSNALVTYSSFGKNLSGGILNTNIISEDQPLFRGYYSLIDVDSSSDGNLILVESRVNDSINSTRRFTYYSKIDNSGSIIQGPIRLSNDNSLFGWFSLQPSEFHGNNKIVEINNKIYVFWWNLEDYTNSDLFYIILNSTDGSIIQPQTSLSNKNYNPYLYDLKVYVWEDKENNGILDIYYENIYFSEGFDSIVNWIEFDTDQDVISDSMDDIINGYYKVYGNSLYIYCNIGTYGLSSNNSIPEISNQGFRGIIFYFIIIFLLTLIILFRYNKKFKVKK